MSRPFVSSHIASDGCNLTSKYTLWSSFVFKSSSGSQVSTWIQAETSEDLPKMKT